MQHPAELAIHSFLRGVLDGKASMPAPVIAEVASDVQEALTKQFQHDTKKREFKIRMSNIGRPKCQLWFDKNKPEGAEPLPVSFKINMIIGDIVEAVFKGLLRASGTSFDDNDKVTLKLSNGGEVSGEYDMVLDGKVDDVKSASPWSFTNKFEDFHTLNKGDTFGYVSQLVGYATAADKGVGGWWVVNKANGDFKYVPASSVNQQEELDKIKATVDTVNSNAFQRCFEPVAEYFRGKPTGNTVLNSGCRFCSYRQDCWDITERPAVKSQAREPKMVSYLSLTEEFV